MLTHFTSWLAEHWASVSLGVSEVAGLISNGKYAGIVKTAISLIGSLFTSKKQ